MLPPPTKPASSPTLGTSRYITDILLRIVSVSVEIVKISHRWRLSDSLYNHCSKIERMASILQYIGISRVGGATLTGAGTSTLYKDW